jgi:hypothetical protein
MSNLIAVTYRRPGDQHQPEDVEHWNYCLLTRVPCLNEFVDLGKEGTWGVVQILHGREGRATIWVELASVADPWSSSR